MMLIDQGSDRLTQAVCMIQIDLYPHSADVIERDTSLHLHTDGQWPKSLRGIREQFVSVWIDQFARNAKLLLGNLLCCDGIEGCIRPKT